MTNEAANPEKKVLQRLGMSQLQCDLRTVFRSQPPARAMLTGLGRIGEYLGADYLVVHARVGVNFLSEEFAEEFDPSDQLRDVINGAMGDVMDGSQARCIRLRSEAGGEDGPTVIAAVLRDAENEPAGAASILLRECARDRAVEVFSAFESILGFVSVLVAQPQLVSESSKAAKTNDAALIGIDADNPVELAFHIAGSLANRHGLDQVAVGLVHGKRVRIASISGMDDVRASNPGVKWIRDAMEEGLDLGQPILFGEKDPETPADCDYPLHRQWSEAVSGDSVATIPVVFGGRTVGMIAIRQAAESGLQRKNLEGYQEEVAPFARLLPLAQRANRGIIKHVADQAACGFRRVAGSTARKVMFSMMALAGLVYWLIFGTLSYSVVVLGRVAAADSQHVSCPQDGTLTKVHVRIGDVVTPGQVLAELDTHLDQLEAGELQARIDAKAIEEDRALVEASAVDRRVLESQRRALVAELATVTERIDRGRIRAALGGVIVSGDPRSRIGYPLQAGVELFQLASQGRVRVIMNVPEDSIVEARNAGNAEFLPAARPDHGIEISALRFPPAATSSDAGMVFEVVTTLIVDDSTGVLLPGMEGVVYMSLGERNAWWVLTHRITDWLRMGFWI
ncbi:MAG: multidrug efflux pump subunit AcrA (membrane-fusion protein) [Planctomycetota bacterium]|jgi:multidrug efflux pump subunit AcrA (membrane-fusion protein)